MSRSTTVAMTDFKNALDLRFVKWGLVMAVAFGPIFVILMIGGTVLFLPPTDVQYAMTFLTPMVPTLLGMFAIIPTTMISANALVGEREMNTLEPLLCTPLTDRELLWGKTMAGAFPSLIILAASSVISVASIAILTMIAGIPIIIIIDLPGLFLLSIATPLMIFAVVAIMIIISGRVTRVYEAYQMSSAVIIVFMIPMILPLLGIESGNISNLVWFSNIVTTLIALVLFVVGWAIALKLFNRDKLVSMV